MVELVDKAQVLVAQPALRGGIELFRRRGIKVDLVAGSVTDSRMGEDYIQNEFGVPAANARRNGLKLFEIVRTACGSGVNH